MSDAPPTPRFHAVHHGARVWQLRESELRHPPLRSSDAVKLKFSAPLLPLGCGVGVDPNRSSVKLMYRDVANHLY
jgi:hypothetical protein